MRPRLRRAAWALALVHALALLAGPLAPHTPQEQHRDHPEAPPTRLHFRDDAGRWHARPFVHPLTIAGATPGHYVEDRSVSLPVQLMVDGPAYTLLGRSWRTHLIGIESDGPLYLLGTDALGRDVLSRLVHGAAWSLTSAMLAVTLTLAIAAAVGAVAGMAGGWLDVLLMGVADLLATLPWIYLLLALRAVLPLDARPVVSVGATVLALALVGWVRPARLVRTVVARSRGDLHVMAARGLGASRRHVLLRHVLPATAGVVLTQAALLAPRFIVAEVTLAFLGLGPGEPTPSWGTMLADARATDLAATWWLLAPAAALVPVCYIYYALADGLQARLGRIE
ncbi:hypothetical protein TBR22_A40430 [Luteitalea sp. TBR-22]|uniref:ABC transporter permease n=1 Tax=Luteitalea sp. TBR-22 TaxID=2802971 RepID=UPI001AF94971|nr:ABC transporter permease [Luteitalea sp. TBR-22]BCS34817.1 hypothetical protein TBR22_A40430 [Luteitalea sp. TBR-22]